MIKSTLKKVTRNLGVEIKRYTPIASENARLAELFKLHQIDLVLDIGSNEGQYVYFLRELGYQGQVISFEPLSSAYQTLELRSKKDPKWQLAPRAALSDFDGETSINIAGNSQSSSVLTMLKSHETAAPESTYVGSETVPVYQLDNIPLPIDLGQYHSIFAKIDVQGLEKQVIGGSKSLLSKIKGMQVELSLVNLYENQTLYQEMIQYLESLGYSLYSISPAFVDSKTMQLLQVDGVFFKS